MSDKTTFPKPKNFPYKEVFYFDKEIALIKGKYNGSTQESIGMRWMVGESDLGYPSTFGNAMWMVVPEKLASFILEGIFSDIENLRDKILHFQEFTDALELVRAIPNKT
jgi:hypothetical protein